MGLRKKILDFIAGEEFEILRKDRSKKDTRTYKITLKSGSTKNSAVKEKEEKLQTLFSVCSNLNLEILASDSWVDPNTPYSFVPKILVAVRGNLENIRGFRKMLDGHSDVVSTIEG